MTRCAPTARTACEACRAELAEGGAIDLADRSRASGGSRCSTTCAWPLGTRLGITEDDQPDFDPSDPAEQPRVAYYWLTAVQDSVVRALMR